MLLWNGLLVLFVLLPGFPWNTARPQLHLLSLTVKNSDVKPRISHCDSQNLQYKAHPEFWHSHRRIFKTSLYYKTRLILETRRYVESWEWISNFISDCITGVITYPCWHWSESMLVKWYPDNNGGRQLHLIFPCPSKFNSRLDTTF